MKKCNFHAFFR